MEEVYPSMVYTIAIYSMVVYLCLDISLYFSLCPVFGDEEAANEEENYMYHVKTFKEVLY